MPDPTPDQKGPEWEEGGSRGTAGPGAQLLQRVSPARGVGKAGVRISPYMGPIMGRVRRQEERDPQRDLYMGEKRSVLLPPERVTASTIVQTRIPGLTDNPPTSQTHTQHDTHTVCPSGSDLAGTGSQR